MSFNTSTVTFQEYKDNYECIMTLPCVNDMARKIEKLTEKNKRLKKENDALRYALTTLSSFQNKKVKKTKLYGNMHKNDVVDDDVVIIKEEKVEKKPVVVVNIEEDEEPDMYTGEEVEVEEEEEEEVVVEVEKTKEEEVKKNDETENVQMEIVEEEEEVDEEEEEEEEEEETNPKAENDDLKNKMVVEEEEEEEEEEAEEEEESEVFEITIEGKSYYTTNEVNGKIYAVDENEEVGDEIGVFENSKPKFYK